MAWYFGSDGFPRYVSIGDRRARAFLEARKLEKRGRTLEPVTLDGRKIAVSLWGKLCMPRAAVRYGVCARFDRQPETFFTLRRVKMTELVAKTAAAAVPAGTAVADASLEAIFGIELDRPRARRR